MINAQNYAQMTSQIDMSQLTKDQQNFHALVLPHIEQFDKDVQKDSDPKVKAKLDAYYNFLSVKMQGATKPEIDKNRAMQMRKRKAIALLLLSNSNK